RTVAARRYAANAAAVPGQPTFAVGAGLDDPSQAPLATRVRIGTVRIGLPWIIGQTAPDPAIIPGLYGLAARNRVVVEIVTQQLPTDDAGRALLGAFATSLAQQVTGIRDVLLGPPPAPTSASAYATALGAVYDAVKAAAPGA